MLETRSLLKRPPSESNWHFGAQILQTNISSETSIRFPWGKRYGGWGYKILRISYENSDRMVKCHQQHSDTPPIASTTLYCKNLLTCLFLFKTKIIGLFSLSPTAWYSAFTHESACCSVKGMGGKKMWSYWQYCGLNKYPESFFFLFFALLFFSFLSFFLFF